MPIFEYFAKTPEAAAVFDAAMTSISTWESKAVVAAYDFTGIGTLLDVAGGHGLMLTTILKAHPKCVAFFSTSARDGQCAKRARDRRPGGRCQTVSGDFFASVPEGGDAYIMKHIIHDWDDERAIQILRTPSRSDAARRESDPPGFCDCRPVTPRTSASSSISRCWRSHRVAGSGRKRSSGTYCSDPGSNFRRVIPSEIHLSLVEGVRA